MPQSRTIPSHLQSSAIPLLANPFPGWLVVISVYNCRREGPLVPSFFVKFLRSQRVEWSLSVRYETTSSRSTPLPLPFPCWTFMTSFLVQALAEHSSPYCWTSMSFNLPFFIVLSTFLSSSFPLVMALSEQLAFNSSPLPLPRFFELPFLTGLHPQGDALLDDFPSFTSSPFFISPFGPWRDL